MLTPMLLFLLDPTKMKMTEREKEETRLVKVHIYLYSFSFINGYGALLVLTIFLRSPTRSGRRKSVW